MSYEHNDRTRIAMDFLKNAALPQPIEHFQLLLFILNLVYVIFFPYLAFLLGSTWLSLRAARKAGKEGSPLESRFANDVIGLALNRVSVVAFLGVIPALTLVFVYAQLLQTTPAISVGLMGYAFLAFLAATILLYSYKVSSTLGALLKTVDSAAASENAAGQLARYRRSAEGTRDRAGRYGFALLVVAVLLAVGALAVAANADSWAEIDTVFALLLAPGFLTKLIQFVSLALAATGVGVIFFFFVWEGGTVGDDEVYARFVRDRVTSLGLVPVLLQPLFLVLSLLFLPPGSLSGVLFALAGLALLLFFLSAQLVYAYHKEHRNGYAAYAFYTLGVALILLFTTDQMATSNATQGVASQLSFASNRATEELKSRLGVAATAMTGEDIYNGRCSACHLFDQKKVGPPYRDVIPKYGGKKGELVAFVLNPVKVDPTYPSMPSQGLKPSEADSIATFLLKKYATRPAAQAPPQQPARPQ